MAPAPSEADIIFNKANVALAKSQRLLASWLPPRKPEEQLNTKTDEELEKEEREMFVPMPETLGVGATVPKDGEVKREELSSNDKLRRQLLGKDYEKKLGKGKREREQAKSRPLQAGSKARPASSKHSVGEDSEDEPGRSALGKPRKNHPKKPLVKPDGDTGEDASLLPDTYTGPPAEHRSSEKRNINYLDEVLEDRSHKKHKKSKKKKKCQESTDNMAS